MNKNFRLHMLVEGVKQADRKNISRMIISHKNGNLKIGDNVLSFKDKGKTMVVDLKEPDDSIIISIVEIVDVLGMDIVSNAKNKKITIDYNNL